MKGIKTVFIIEKVQKGELQRRKEKRKGEKRKRKIRSCEKYVRGNED